MGNYIIEFISMGNVVKVTAIDPDTGIEVSSVAPAKLAQNELTKLAVNKLEYVLKRDKK